MKVTENFRIPALDADVSWQRDAVCLGLVTRGNGDLFFTHEEPGFGPAGNPARLKQARIMCSMCPVQQKCLQFAVNNDCAGVWGGTTERQRKKMLNEGKISRQ